MIVDDEEAARYGMRRALSTFGYNITEAGSAEAARALLKQTEPDLLLLDVNLPGMSGLDFLREVKSSNGNGPLVIIVTAHGSERMAVEAVKAGAYDYLSKPFELDDLRLVVKNAAETVQLRRENYSLRRRIEVERSQRGALIGNSDAMQKVRAMIEKVAETDATVLVRGESGTGKELVARELHERNSVRRNASFVAVNCAALPSELIESELFGHEKGAFTGAAARREGKFEQADSGTLFLDEIGDMSSNVQAKLLRALEERRIERLGANESIPVDVRIVSATHRPLEQEITNGNFRADLFYRLRVVTVEIAPLRERREDIPLLAETFVRMAGERYELPQRSLSQAALRRLVEYNWPGNVRELKNTIDRAVIMAEGDEIAPKDLPDEITAGMPRNGIVEGESETDGLRVPFTADFREDRREFERRYITRCLEYTQGNVTRAAEILDMHRQSLQHKLRQLGLGRRYVSVNGEVQDNPDS
ncbi:MAG TPA: sigma-54 dependent transcriptional regulator [Pyrinomonadaceae bacterium]|jgi:DNA-binding NtrC family response regulator|nr:sigma-54 dependent transcriptional regulator [Pyrinomonadaceae bacterium]